MGNCSGQAAPAPALVAAQNPQKAAATVPAEVEKEAPVAAAVAEEPAEDKPCKADAPKPALLVIDMQNDFMHADGACARMGFPDAGTPILPEIKLLVDAARARKAPVVWIVADYSDAVVGPAFGAKMKAFPEACCVTDWGRSIVDQLAPAKGELVVTKHCYNGFHETRLAAELRAAGVDRIIATGILSTVCVESTVRQAVFEGFHTTIASDAVGDAPEATAAFLGRFSTFFGQVQTAKEIADAWAAEETA